MSFYRDWLLATGNTEKENVFLQQYLDYSPESLETLTVGDNDDVVEAIRLLLSIPILRLLDAINHPYPLSPKDIFQYSKLDDATDTLCTILEFEENRLSYEEAGQRLTHASQQYACIKYGENHAKTAAMLTLVLIGREPDRKCNMVRISSLGSVSTMLSVEEKHELIKRLAVRNPLIKTLIYEAKTNGYASYIDTVSVALSGQTIIRRKHNNEIIMNLILEDLPLKDQIRWQ